MSEQEPVIDKLNLNMDSDEENEEPSVPEPAKVVRKPRVVVKYLKETF
jgi:hypothetical protein